MPLLRFFLVRRKNMFTWIIILISIMWTIGVALIVDIFFILYNHYKNKEYHYEDWMYNLTDEEKILVEQYMENIDEDE